MHALYCLARVHPAIVRVVGGTLSNKIHADAASYVPGWPGSGMLIEILQIYVFLATLVWPDARGWRQLSRCPPQAHTEANAKSVKELHNLAERYDKAVAEEAEMTPEKRVVAAAGKLDARKRLAAGVTDLMASNIVQTMGAMLDTVVF